MISIGAKKMINIIMTRYTIAGVCGRAGRYIFATKIKL
jgi:hypothetical protein